MATKPLGDRGEAVAVRHLEAAGWTVIDRNFRIGRKEIDIVARLGDVIAFVEVKTRTGTGYGHPLESVTWRKRREIQQVAAGWVNRFGQQNFDYRFDAIGILGDARGTPIIEHVEDAWRI